MTKQLADGTSVSIDTPTKSTSNGRVLLTQDEIDERNIEEAAELAKKPMRDWEKQMQSSDAGMSREMEDHITDHHNGLAGSSFSQAKYDEKILLRSQKPV